MKRSLVLIFIFFALKIFGQNPTPAAPQAKPVVIKNATIHSVSNGVIENGTIIFDKGIITYVGLTASAPNLPEAEVIDATGKSIYPGLVAPNAWIGLQEIGALRHTNDIQELGDYNPNVRSLIAYNTDSEVIPTIRGNGILTAQIVPEGGTITGTSSIMELDGWNWEDAALKKDDGLWVNWPSYFSRSYNFAEGKLEQKKNEKRLESIAELKSFFTEAKAYLQIKNPTDKNVKFDAMAGVFSGEKTLYIRADYGKEIFEAVRFCKDLNIKKLVLVGAEEADLVLDLLKAEQIPVLVMPTHTIPSGNDDDVYKIYKLPKKLHDAGLLVGTYYTEEFWRTRNLPFIAGTSAAFGLTKDQALSMITLNNAKILGIDSKIGSLEMGKRATLLVSSGDILDMKTSKVEMAFINGKRIDLDDKQKRLNRKFSEKYNIQTN